MKKIILVLFAAVIAVSANAQEKKKLFKDFLKYSTIYVSGDIKNSKENAPNYFVRTNPNGSLYDVPVVVDGTDYYEHDYRYGFGIRKIARFDYEMKGKQYDCKEDYILRLFSNANSF